MESRNNCKQQLVTWGPAHMAIATPTAEPKAGHCPHAARLRWESVTRDWGWWYQECLEGNLQAGYPHLDAGTGQHGVFPRVWHSAAVVEAGALWRAGALPPSIRHCTELHTDVSRCCKRGWDLTAGQEAAQGKSGQTHSSCGAAGTR